MSYRYDEQARREAGAHRIRDDSVEKLASLCAEKLKGLGAADVGGHEVEFQAAQWRGLTGMPDRFCDEGRITRADLLDMGGRVCAGDVSPVTLLAASFAWGTGMTGYGPHRYAEIAAAAGDALASIFRVGGRLA
jgi:hypothetical protein